MQYLPSGCTRGTAWQGALMPKAPRRCPAPGCDELIRNRKYCEEHTIPWVGSNRGKATSISSWRTLRDKILERDDWICYLCRQPSADTVDHIVPVSRGGTDIPSNLAAVHDRTPPHCHRDKTVRDRT